MRVLRSHRTASSIWSRAQHRYHPWRFPREQHMQSAWTSRGSYHLFEQFVLGHGIIDRRLTKSALLLDDLRYVRIVEHVVFTLAYRRDFLLETFQVRQGHALERDG